jgi:hypothetical protein
LVPNLNPAQSTAKFRSGLKFWGDNGSARPIYIAPEASHPNGSQALSKVSGAVEVAGNDDLSFFVNEARPLGSNNLRQSVEEITRAGKLRLDDNLPRPIHEAPHVAAMNPKERTRPFLLYWTLGDLCSEA